MKKTYQFETLDEFLDYFVTGAQPRSDEFESLCGDLCEAMGIKVKKRPKADGSGTSMSLSFAGEKGAILCLCYKPDEQVSRGDVTRFVKENPDASSRNMVVMTTSTFAPGAFAYCSGTGIRAIGGEQVMGLMRKHGFILERVVVKIEEPVIRDLREKKEKKAVVIDNKPKIVAKSPLAGMAFVQNQQVKSQRLDARQWSSGTQKIKPFR